jgi:hypothetical protein
MDSARKIRAVRTERRLDIAARAWEGISSAGDVLLER